MTGESVPSSGEDLVIPEVSAEGLMAVLEWGKGIETKLGELTAEAKSGVIVVDGSRAQSLTSQISQLSEQLRITVAAMDRILPREDGASWREQMAPETPAAEEPAPEIAQAWKPEPEYME